MQRSAISRWLLAVTAVLFVGAAFAGREANIRNTKHNFSSTSTNPVRATGNTGRVDGAAAQVGGNEVCVFCHAPHGAVALDAAGNAVGAPLWNRRVKDTTYTPYKSTSLDADPVAGDTGQPGASSKVCLSCHDGTVAIGNVGVTAGTDKSVSGPGGSDTGVEIPFQGTDNATSGFGGTMPAGSNTVATGFGTDSGFTRRLGVDLSNDHPISVSFTKALADADGELRVPSNDSFQSVAGQSLAQGSNRYTRQSFTVAVANRGNGHRPLLPLYKESGGSTGQVACASCHDPHLADDTWGSSATNKFLRANRFQRTAPNKIDNLETSSGAQFDADRDIICLACHSKAYDVWGKSAHADDTLTSGVAYKNGPAALREFPTGIKVWQASCLNCHDPHTNPNAKRLLREGSDQGYTSYTISGQTTWVKKGAATDGSAIEETCLMCHRPYNDARQILDLANSSIVPDVYTDFTSSSSYRMPIASNDQYIGSEGHSIGNMTTTGKATALAGKDFAESPENLGSASGNFSAATSRRHAECTDCHNPHRITRGNHATATNGQTDIRGTAGGNAVSNVLKGGYGVEPIYGTSSTAFGKIPTGFEKRCGSGRGTRYQGTGANDGCTGDLQYEYQICFKCHSNFAYNDVDGPSTAQYNYAGRPTIGGTGLTPAGDSRFAGDGNGDANVWPAGSRYTNQAMEFWGPASHKGETNSSGTEPSHGMTGEYATPNHRSWHPVMTSTGRTSSERGGANSPFLSPWLTNLGNQTMYCSDCHGNASSQASNNNPDGSRPWGPHGSTNPFILKGLYNTDAGAVTLCLKCHSPTSGTSGFCCDNKGNLHAYHMDKINLARSNPATGLRCNWCHVAVPHGWKNKALLADLTNLGNEVGVAEGTSVTPTALAGYTKGPYYMNAMLRVTTWRRSGAWTSGDCNGGISGMRNTCQW